MEEERGISKESGKRRDEASSHAWPQILGSILLFERRLSEATDARKSGFKLELIVLDLVGSRTASSASSVAARRKERVSIERNHSANRREHSQIRLVPQLECRKTVSENPLSLLHHNNDVLLVRRVGKAESDVPFRSSQRGDVRHGVEEPEIVVDERSLGSRGILVYEVSRFKTVGVKSRLRAGGNKSR